MKPAVLKSFALVFILSACAPLKTYYKPGATVSALNRDTTACEVKALHEVPQVFLIRRLPPRYIPGRRKCDAAGKCFERPGFYVDGGVESYDPNVGLRNRVERQCMADKGYAPVSIPLCPENVAKAAPAGVTTRLPNLRETSCVIRNSDGTFQIVTQG
jgi:hypothetical protein